MAQMSQADAPGAMDFQDREPENGEHVSGETEQKGSGFYEGAA